MLVDLYQQYLFLIGKLKDIHGLHVDVDHKDIHTFFLEKQPLFKLFYGVFGQEEGESPDIVVSFHIDLSHPEAIIWFTNIHKIHPLIRINDSYVEDSNGETYLGEDALAINEVYRAQEVLGEWLENSDRDEMKQFAESKVTGRETPDKNKSYDSQKQRQEAILEFDRMRKPDDEGNVQ